MKCKAGGSATHTAYMRADPTKIHQLLLFYVLFAIIAGGLLLLRGGRSACRAAFISALHPATDPGP